MATDNAWDKIRLKSAPKQYKRGPGPTGKDRLERRVNALMGDAARLLRKPVSDDDEAWCAELILRLQHFNAWVAERRYLADRTR